MSSRAFEVEPERLRAVAGAIPGWGDTCEEAGAEIERTEIPSGSFGSVDHSEYVSSVAVEFTGAVGTSLAWAAADADELSRSVADTASAYVQVADHAASRYQHLAADAALGRM
ncbi:MAG: hypothetical protein ACRCY8_16665 [Dermatophilaceae bacterium]